MTRLAEIADITEPELRKALSHDPEIPCLHGRGPGPEDRSRAAQTVSATTAIIVLGEGRKTTRPNLGHYGVTALIGEGGMREVYRARTPNENRRGKGKGTG